MSRSEDDNMAGSEPRRRAPDSAGGGRTPAFNLPGVVVAFAAILVGVHLALTLTPLASYQYLVFDWLGFIPLRLSHAGEVPGGVVPLLWTPVTHAFLHSGGSISRSTWRGWRFSARRWRDATGRPGSSRSGRRAPSSAP